EQPAELRTVLRNRACRLLRVRARRAHCVRYREASVHLLASRLAVLRVHHRVRRTPKVAHPQLPGWLVGPQDVLVEQQMISSSSSSSSSPLPSVPPDPAKAPPPPHTHPCM
ncbi:hypothetical protein DIPPA_30925, partial [Diplonema papillatum]